jgi:TonB family protein
VNWSSMRRHARPLVLGSVMAAMSLFAFQPASAQAVLRKVKNRVDPVYPDLAKRNNIHGSARVELLITTDGRVKDVKVLGGNPVLVDAVVTAVMKWKYEPAPEESSVVVKFDFAL